MSQAIGADLPEPETGVTTQLAYNVYGHAYDIGPRLASKQTHVSLDPRKLQQRARTIFYFTWMHAIAMSHAQGKDPVHFALLFSISFFLLFLLHHHSYSKLNQGEVTDPRQEISAYHYCSQTGRMEDWLMRNRVFPPSWQEKRYV